MKESMKFEAKPDDAGGGGNDKSQEGSKKRTGKLLSSALRVWELGQDKETDDSEKEDLENEIEPKSNDYRDNLARTVRSVNSRSERKEILEANAHTSTYENAKEAHLEDIKKHVEEREESPVVKLLRDHHKRLLHQYSDEEDKIKLYELEEGFKERKEIPTPVLFVMTPRMLGFSPTNLRYATQFDRTAASRPSNSASKKGWTPPEFGYENIPDSKIFQKIKDLGIDPGISEEAFLAALENKGKFIHNESYKSSIFSTEDSVTFKIGSSTYLDDNFWLVASAEDSEKAKAIIEKIATPECFAESLEYKWHEWSKRKELAEYHKEDVSEFPGIELNEITDFWRTIPDELKPKVKAHLNVGGTKWAKEVKEFIDKSNSE